MIERKLSKPLALCVALLSAFALALPLAGSAAAGHTAWVNAEPERDVNAPRTSHTITAYASAPGVEIDFNIECDESDSTPEPDVDPQTTDPECTSPNTDSDATLPTDRSTSDYSCTTSASATTNPDPTNYPGQAYSCSITYTDTGSNADSDTDYIRVWSDEETTPAGGDDTYDPGEPMDTVVKVWENDAVLDCEPETATNPTTGPESSHTINCTVTTSAENGGEPLAGAVVNFENESTEVNDPDDNASRTSPDNTCTTDADGECSATYESEGESGTATIRAWVNRGGSGGDDSDSSETQATEDEDNTDVVTKTWATSGGIEARPETDRNPVGTEHTVFAYTDQPGVEVNFNIESGPNSNDDDPPAPVGDPTTSDYECTTGTTPDPNDPGEPNRYSCSWTYVGAGGEGTDNIRVWIDTGPGDDFDDDTYETGEPNDFVQKTWYEQDASRAQLNCEPETATNPTIGPESDHQITCTVSDQEGAPFLGANVDFENESPTVNDPDDNADRTDPDNTCTTSDESDSDGTCTVTYESENQAGTATIRAWVDEDESDDTDDSDSSETQAQEDADGTDVVTKTWEAVEIDASPEEDKNPVGAQHTIVATTGDPGVEVNFNIEEGPHEDDPAPVTGEQSTSDYECVTDSNPEGGYNCSWTYEGTEEGTDTIRVWFDEGTNDDEYQEGEPNDVVTKTWYTQNMAQARLDCEPETGTNPAEGEGSDHTITCTVRDQENNPFFNARVHFENESPNVNDPDNNADRTNPDKNCTTPDAPDGNGQCQVTYTSEGQTGTATIRAWVDNDNNPSTDNADAGETQATNDQDNTDVVTKTWVGDGRTIECTPETGVNPVGTDHVVTCTVLDRNGQPVPGESVTFTSSGVGSVSPTGGTTDQNGRVSTTARSSQPGQQTITATITDDMQGGEPNHVDECDRAANDPQGAPAGQCQDSVTKTWEPNDNPECDDDVDNDQDGETDYPADPGCTSAQDNDETDPTVVTRGPCTGYEQGSTNPKRDGSGSVIVGTPGDDALVGTDGGDIICGLAGDDVIDAGGGNDQVVGNSGNDQISGGGGRDQLSGNADRDTISGRDGNDVINGGAGRDSLKGNVGIDTLKGQDDNDTLQGGRGEDTLIGADGSDIIRGWTQNDILSGGAGSDVLHGGKGRADVCRPGPGRDTVRACERR